MLQFVQASLMQARSALPTKPKRLAERSRRQTRLARRKTCIFRSTDYVRTTVGQVLHRVAFRLSR